MKVTHTSNPENNNRYSEIITPEEYNHINGEQHLYIAEADRLAIDFLKEKTALLDIAEVVELGCGPGRTLELLATIPHIKLSAIDIDDVFLNYCRKLISNSAVTIRHADLVTYQHPTPVDFFYSQGVHHHISKGQKTKDYLTNIFSQLKPGGYYILSDEFIPDYTDEHDRNLKLVVWYSHIISNAQKNGFNYLAQEEAKILLDDLQEGRALDFGYKSENQIKAVVAQANAIDKAAIENNLAQAYHLTKTLLSGLVSSNSQTPSGDQTLDLSRKDYKISDQAFKAEIKNIGFIVEQQIFVGLSETIGGMVIYILQKPSAT